MDLYGEDLPPRAGCVSQVGGHGGRLLLLRRRGRVRLADQPLERLGTLAAGVLLKGHAVDQVREGDEVPRAGPLERRQRDETGDDGLLRRGAEQEGGEVDQHHSGEKTAEPAAELVQKRREDELPLLRHELVGQLHQQHPGQDRAEQHRDGGFVRRGVAGHPEQRGDHAFGPDREIYGKGEVQQRRIAFEQAAAEADQRADDGDSPENQVFHLISPPDSA